MNARLLVAIALVFCAVAARAEETEAGSSELARLETVEPTFVETAAVAESEAFPFELPKKLRRTTVEPSYYGEDNKKPKEFVHPEYRDPTLIKAKRNNKHKRNNKKPVVFTSHYFSPMPKTLKGKKLRAKRDKKGRRLVPFRATVETPTGHLLHTKGHVVAELRDGRLPNKFDDPRQRNKKTRAPAPLSLIEAGAEAAEEGEVDTTDAMEADAEAEGPVPPPFQHDLGEQQARVVQTDEFYDANFVAPTWQDEEATEAELSSLVEVHAEDEEEEESEDEEEAEEEEEAEDEDESEEEADEESEDEEEAPVSLLESSAAGFDANDAEMDEMAANELAAQQVDMDATSDEAAMNEEVAAENEVDAKAGAEEVISETIEDMDADELSSDSEADSSEEVIEEGEALDEAETADAVALVEEGSDAEAIDGVDTLLAEIDAHLNGAGEGEGEAEAAAEADTAAAKGTPGHAIAAGQTWEDAQNERLNAMEAQLAAERSSVPKVAAAVVASKAELSAVDSAHQLPAYDSEAERVEMVEPQLMVETAAAAAATAPAPNAQAVLLEKIAKLKAIRRA